MAENKFSLEDRFRYGNLEVNEVTRGLSAGDANVGAADVRRVASTARLKPRASEAKSSQTPLTKCKSSAGRTAIAPST